MFRFANTEILWLLLLLPLYILLLIYIRYRRTRRLARFATKDAFQRLTSYSSLPRFWWKSILLGFALIFLILGLARPQFGLKQTKQRRNAAEIMFVLDVSKSMLAEDVRPNRLERAKLEILQLMRKLKDDRVGLILFAGRAYVQLPITSDNVSAQMFISKANCEMISEQGTVLGDAIDLALNSFSPQADVGHAIVIISDGESHEGNPIEKAEEAAQKDVRIFTVGIGSPEGVPIPEVGGGVKKDANGNIIMSKLDEVTLSQIAAKANGIYMRAAAGPSGLTPILDEIETMQRAEFEQVAYSVYDEQFQTAFIIALFFFIASLLVMERKHPWFNLDRLFAENKEKK